MKLQPIPSSEITPEHVYLSRRQFMRGAAALAASALALAACASPSDQPSDQSAQATAEALQTPELPDTLNTYDEITHYNNFYEFSVEKTVVADYAKDFKTSPWQVDVGGLVNKPGVYDIDTLRKQFDQEERIYRLRCVEGWSMVIPWMGFPLNKLLKLVEPTADAKYVRITTLDDKNQFPGQIGAFFPWPYTEGLRLDEAMNDLAILATGLYGKNLPPQDGAPIRLVVPWKYGFKSIKSIVKIELVTEMPVSFWMSASPDEYGFYANVNPDVPHPRWSQASERRLGQNGGRMRTLFLNGYAEQVAYLYKGMDLKANF
jgi:methionine sulfoxide reductase catalytic subunit